jgi:hypothetical protein
MAAHDVADLFLRLFVKWYIFGLWGWFTAVRV